MATYINVRSTPELKTLIARAAVADGRTSANWIRRTLELAATTALEANEKYRQGGELNQAVEDRRYEWDEGIEP